MRRRALLTALIAVAAMAAWTPPAQAQDMCVPVFIFQVCPVEEALYQVGRVQQEVNAAGDVQGIQDSKIGCGQTGPPFVRCARSGDDDMPRKGYTVDRLYDCGQIRGGTICWANGTTQPDRTEWHHWGWGSADYDGSGAPVVCVGGMFSDCRQRLARACYYASCNDQDIEADAIGIHHGHHDHNHTIFGHAKA